MYSDVYVNKVTIKKKPLRNYEHYLSLGNWEGEVSLTTFNTLLNF